MLNKKVAPLERRRYIYGMDKTTEVWNDFADQLYRYILTIVKDQELSKDVLQDTFVKIHRSIASLKEEEKMLPWLLRIARNTAIDALRSRKFTEPVVDVVAEEREEEGCSVCLSKAIQQLPSPYQEAIQLSEIEGKKQKEIAKTLGLSYSGLKSRVQRGRELLKQALIKCCNLKVDAQGKVDSCSDCDCD